MKPSRLNIQSPIINMQSPRSYSHQSGFVRCNSRDNIIDVINTGYNDSSDKIYLLGDDTDQSGNDDSTNDRQFEFLDTNHSGSTERIGVNNDPAGIRDSKGIKEPASPTFTYSDAVPNSRSYDAGNFFCQNLQSDFVISILVGVFCAGLFFLIVLLLMNFIGICYRCPKDLGHLTKIKSNTVLCQKGDSITEIPVDQLVKDTCYYWILIAGSCGICGCSFLIIFMLLMTCHWKRQYQVYEKPLWFDRFQV